MNPYKSEPPVGGSRAHIMSMFPSLVPSEQRVAQFCLDAPEAVSTMSVADLVAQTGTSPATVVRACKRLGFDGFQHLRQVLLRDLGAAAATLPSRKAGARQGRRARRNTLSPVSSRKLHTTSAGRWLPLTSMPSIRPLER